MSSTRIQPRLELTLTLESMKAKMLEFLQAENEMLESIVLKELAAKIERFDFEQEISRLVEPVIEQQLKYSISELVRPLVVNAISDAASKLSTTGESGVENSAARCSHCACPSCSESPANEGSEE